METFDEDRGFFGVEELDNSNEQCCSEDTRLILTVQLLEKNLTLDQFEIVSPTSSASPVRSLLLEGDSASRRRPLMLVYSTRAEVNFCVKRILEVVLFKVFLATSTYTSGTA